MKLQLIDDLSLPDHYFLTSDDNCYFILSYTARKPPNYSDDNSIITNIKKSPERRNQTDWRYKDKDMRKCGSFIKNLNIFSVFSENITIVPVPPSKIKDDPNYDNRLNQILEYAFEGSVDVRDLIVQIHSTAAIHTTDQQRDSNWIRQNYSIDDSLTANVKDNIIIFDDVLTTGSHYVACKEILLERFPHSTIFGLFIARRISPTEELTLDELLG